MGQSAIANALRRKTSVGQRAREVRGLTPTRALRIALARAAGDLWELPLSVTGLTHELVDVEGLLERFDDETMLLLLDGPNGVRGGMAVDRALLTSVTEVQTIGEVSGRPPSTRAFTPTDAALFAPLVDSMLERLDVSLNSDHNETAACDRSEAAWALGYRFGAQVERKRSLLLALEGEAFHLLRLEIDIAAGLRQGSMMICLPIRVLREEPREGDGPAEPGEHADALSSVPTRLSATLPSLHLPLAQATALAVGDLLPIGKDALLNVLLRASDEQIIARCTLGKVGDMRALRLHAKRGQAAPPMPRLASDEGLDSDSGRARDAADPDGETQRFVAHVRSSRPVSAVAPEPAAMPTESPDMAAPAAEDEALPDLPPLDFDAPVDPDGDFDMSNVNFE